MPRYRVTDTLTGAVVITEQPTDWDAWMHFRMTSRIRSGGGPMFFDNRFRVTNVPSSHHYAVEQIDPDTGAVFEGTYLTMFLEA